MLEKNPNNIGENGLLLLGIFLSEKISSENQLDFPLIVLYCALLQVWISCIKPCKLEQYWFPATQVVCVCL